MLPPYFRPCNGVCFYDNMAMGSHGFKTKDNHKDFTLQFRDTTGRCVLKKFSWVITHVLLSNLYTSFVCVVSKLGIAIQGYYRCTQMGPCSDSSITHTPCSFFAFNCFFAAHVVCNWRTPLSSISSEFWVDEITLSKHCMYVELDHMVLLGVS